MDSSRKLIDAIKEGQIQPRPRWQFRLKNNLILAGFLFTVLLGSLAFSVVLIAIQQVNFNITSHMTHSRLEFFLSMLPVFWIVLLICALRLRKYGIGHSRKGYKCTLARQMGYSAGLSILLGTLFFITGGAHLLEHAYGLHVDTYESIEERRIRFWMDPQGGQLAGEIVKAQADSLVLMDFRGEQWTVLFDKGLSLEHLVHLEKGEKVKLVGLMLGENRFKAREIGHWQMQSNQHAASPPEKE